MTRDDFRKLALSMPETTESSHLGRPDFRVRNKIFATLGPRDPGLAVVKLTLDEQDFLSSAEAAIFAPIPGGWGHRGWTHVHLPAIDETTLRSALTMAWRNVAPKRLAATFHLPPAQFGRKKKSSPGSEP
jgi:hypothetical protein